jgi:hypothetical protein
MLARFFATSDCATNRFTRNIKHRLSFLQSSAEDDAICSTVCNKGNIDCRNYHSATAVQRHKRKKQPEAF